jgi:hypothetical protein
MYRIDLNHETGILMGFMIVHNLRLDKILKNITQKDGFLLLGRCTALLGELKSFERSLRFHSEENSFLYLLR